MPTRISSKPSSYTFSSGTRFGANMQAGWVFLASDISGSSVTDVTGNGRTLTLQGTSAVEATDATHGQCLRSDGTNGADLVPPAAWNTLTDYTLLIGLQAESNTAASLEWIMELINTAGGQDTCAVNWATSENVVAKFEDADTSNQDATIVDGINNNANEWITVAAVCNGTSQTADLYIIVDGDATQVANLTTTGVTGATTNNLFRIVQTWHGLCEFAYVYDTALSQANVEAVHVDPYAELGSGTFTIDSTTPTTPVSGASLVINLSNANNASGKTVTYNGHTVTPDSQDINSITINSWPDLTSLGTRTSDYQTAYNIEVTDGGDSSTISKATDPQANYDYFTISGEPFPQSSIYYNDIGVANGQKHYGYVESGSIDSIDTNGIINGYTQGTIYRYKVYDTDWQANYATATLNFEGTLIPISTANASGIPPVEPGGEALPMSSANASGIVPQDSTVPLADAQASGVAPQEVDTSFWETSPPSTRLIAFK